MRLYSKEIEALKRSGRFRKREIFPSSLKDFASNDYLGFASNKKLMKKFLRRLSSAEGYGAKASMLVNGYSPEHAFFEEMLCKINGFEEAIVLGSGFLANLALLEALPRRGDLLVMDEEYHASGILAASLCKGEVKRFSHNDPEELRKILKNSGARRKIVAVEGVYSMSGDLLKREIFEVAEEFSALLIVDEAHSSGVVGDSLGGVFDLYGIEPSWNHIKMGTMGKAYGSYGAYILASKEIVTFLENRSKSIIYTTALSIGDTLYAAMALERIAKKRRSLLRKINKRKDIIRRFFDWEPGSLIVPVAFRDIDSMLRAREALLNEGYLVGAIRPPTVKEPILRIIAGLGNGVSDLKRVLKAVTLQKGVLGVYMQKN